MSDISKEQTAHDLAIIYGLYSSIKNSEERLTPNDFVVNYQTDYEEMLKLLETL